MLAALAAVAVMVTTDDGGAPTFHVGVEWLAVFLCLGLVAWRKNLFLGLAGAVAIVVVARATWGRRGLSGRRLSRGAPRPRSRRAGSDAISADTATSVEAGRMAPKTSPWTAMTARRQRDVRDEHPGPDDVLEREPALGRAPVR